ncbi:MAG: sporulation protein YqfD [Bacilli bacterium]|nr:sporulation protein YqfD [Bacilli bacterium]
MNNNYIKVLIEGKNVNNYIKWLINQRINIINLNVVKHNELEIIINYKDYKLLKKYSKTYKIKIIKKYGTLKLIELMKRNLFIILWLVLAIAFLYFLSNIIFSVEIVYNDKEMIENIEKELKKYGIEKYKQKKEYTYLSKIKEEILKNNKDTIEWIEIIEDGTKYIVRLVERKKEEFIKEYEYQSISTTKDAIITSIKATSGEKIKEINEYVKADDIIVSGIITKPDSSLVYTKAKATIYGEVWYEINIEYPYVYKEEKVNGKSKDVYVINFLSKKIPIFSYKKYKNFKVETNNIIESNILPISISKEKQYEVIVKEEIYTWEEAISNAIDLAKKKLLENNNKIINIKKVEILDKQTIDSKIKLNLFISVEEDITKIVEVKKEETKEKDLQN